MSHSAEWFRQNFGPQVNDAALEVVAERDRLRAALAASEAGAAAWAAWLDDFEAKTRAIPCGAEDEGKGKSIYNWRISFVREARAVLPSAGSSLLARLAASESQCAAIRDVLEDIVGEPDPPCLCNETGRDEPGCAWHGQRRRAKLALEFTAGSDLLAVVDAARVWKRAGRSPETEIALEEAIARLDGEERHG